MWRDGARGKVRDGARAELVKSLRDLVGSAVKVAEGPPAKGRAKDSRAFHTLVNALDAGGQLLAVKLTVREAKRVPEGAPAHSFYKVAIKKWGGTGAVHGPGGVVDGPLDPASAGASGVSVGQLAREFKIG